MNRRAVTLVLAVALMSIGAFLLGHQDGNDFSVLPTVAAPAPPGAMPSRKQTGGPGLRQAWEILRLADPATGHLPLDIHRREQEFARHLPQRHRSAVDTYSDPAWATDSPLSKVSGWTSRGPWNIGGRTRALAIDVSDLTYQTLLAGGVSGGMWRTTDDGGSWNLTTGSSQLHSVSALAQDTRPGSDSTWYYGTGEIRGNSAAAAGAFFRGDGVFKSVDGGVTWALLPATSAASVTVFSGEWQYVNRIATDPSELVADELYAAVFGFIERSVDGGDTWTRVLGDAVARSRYTDVVVSSTGVVYASLSSDGGTSGVFRSPDGLTWTEITPASLLGHNRVVLALAPANESVLYILVSDHNGTTGEGFYKYNYLSGDGSGAGGSWSDRSAQMAALPGPGADEPMECYSSYCQVVTVNPADPDEVYLGGVNLIRSTDGFATNSTDTWLGGWQYPDHHADQHWLLFQPGSDSVAYTGSDGGVHKTSDLTAGNVVWQSLSNGYNTSQFYTVAIDENLPGSEVLIGGMQDNGTWFTGTSNSTDPWVEVLGGDGSSCVVNDASGAIGTYVVSAQYGQVYRMEVDNVTGAWTAWTRIDPSGSQSYLFVNPLITNPNNTNQLYIGSDEGVWRNSDITAIPLWSEVATGVNWSQLTQEPAGGVAVSALVLSRRASPTLYYGTEQGQLFRLDHADTAMAGSVPTLLDMGVAWPTGSYVSDIAIHPDTTGLDQLLVSVSNYNVSSVFYSADGGSNWAAVEGNLAGTDGPSVRTVAFMPSGVLTLYLVGTSTGLYSTFALEEAATIWSLEAPDLVGNVVVDQLAVRHADGLVVAGTHGKGVFSLNVPSTAAVGERTPRSVQALNQNVPNPFNPKTTLSFVLPEAGQTSLVVYDVAGRLVRTLVKTPLAAGAHSFVWRGADDAGHQVTSGVYLYQLRSGSLVETRRMILVR